MQSIKVNTEAIVAREGGYVHDRDDPGGATKFGVTLGTMRRLGLDLDRDGQVTVADVRKLNRAQAAEIFIGHCFTRTKVADLPEILQATVHDMYVNAGSNAVRILQRLVRDMRIDVAVDGVIGPKTIAAARLAAEAAPDHLADAYGIARRNCDYALADARPASRKFARRPYGGKGGWIVRAEEFISTRCHLTEAQHRERTARWA
jgi:lysozyme family protein